MAKFKGAEKQNKGKKLAIAPTIEDNPEKQSPVFSLRHVDKSRYTLSDCTPQEKASFADKIWRLSQLTWAELKVADKHGLGCEVLPQTAIKRATIPGHLSADTKLVVFRFCAKAPMVGYRERAIFHIIWFDRDFTLYDHGS